MIAARIFALFWFLLVAECISQESDKSETNAQYSVSYRCDEKEMVLHLSSEITMAFVWIPPGIFYMGSPTTETGHRADEFQHVVRLTNGFWMSKYEVTRRQWAAVCRGNDDVEQCVEIGPDLPAEIQRFDDVNFFVGEINRRTGCKMAVSLTFRLPSEAEWEYACRAGSQGAYSCSLQGIKDYAWFAENTPVSLLSKTVAIVPGDVLIS